MRFKRSILLIVGIVLCRCASAQEPPTMDESFWRMPHEERHRLSEQRATRRYEPDGKGKRANLSRYIEKFQELNIYDPKSSYCKISATLRPLSKSVVLTGEVLFTEYRQGLERTLTTLGFKIRENSITVLPVVDPVLGDERPGETGLSVGTNAFALATTYTVGLYRDPRPRSEMLDQAIYGEPLRLLKPSEDQKFFLAQTLNGYVGWVRGDFIERMDLATWHRWRSSFPRVRLVNNLVTRHPMTNQILEIPRGAILPMTQPPRSAGARGHFFVLLPDGTIIDALPQICELIQPNPERSREKILALARPLMGVRYVWGGSTDRGLDCSGFTGFLYHMIGVNIPRDADQQSAVGDIVAFRGYMDGLLPGDLIFFVGRTGRVSHVAMSLGGLDFIHSSHPEVKLGSFDPQSPYYEARLQDGFAFARRILPAGF